jgi:hypothetical protein
MVKSKLISQLLGIARVTDCKLMDEQFLLQTFELSITSTLWKVSDVIILFEWHFVRWWMKKNLETWIIDYIHILKPSDVIILLNGNSKVMDEQFVKHR